jgi:hypothetical protein
MKSIFLVALVFLALDWPKSSVCWPMQQYSDFSQANPLFEHGSIKSASSEKQEEQAAAIQQQTEWIQQHQQQQQQQQHQNEWAEQQKQNDWNQEHQESQWSQIEQPSKVEEAKILTLKRPTTSNQEFFRQMNLPQQQQFQQQQQHLYNKQQQLQQQHEEEQQHLLDAPALEESSNINKETLKFKYAKPDLVHTVGMDTVKNEAMKVSRQREENKDTEVPLSHRGKGRGNGFNRELLGGFDTLGGRFNSLIIIANSNSNANLGVATLDPDLFRSFLSQFAGKSVDEVLKDRELDDKFAKFNQEHRLTDEEKDEDPDKDQDKDKDRDNGGKKTKKRGKTEKTTELSANIPGYTGKPSNSHSDSTIVLKKESRASEGESTKNLGYVDPSNFYNYYNYQDGGVIVINNVNDNHNHRIRSILSGEGINLGDQSAGLVLPLSKGEIDRLMEDAIIINNENRNKNRHH